MSELDFTPNEWNPELDQKILELYLIQGLGTTAISADIGVSYGSIRRRLRRLGADSEDRGNPLKFYELMGLETPEEFQPHIYPVRPQYAPHHLPIVDPELKHATTVDEISLHWSDTHFPFHDPSAVSCLYAIANDIWPSQLVMQGDLIDLWQISNHRPPLETKLKADQIDIQNGLNQSMEHLATMRTLAQADCKRTILFGNHEDRFDRLLADMQLNPKMMALMRIPKIQEILNLDYILGLSDEGWSVHSYLEGDRYLLHDRLLCIHGYRSNVYSSKSHLQDYGKSVIFGHSHRIQSWTSRDLRGTDAAWNMGCLCDLNPHWRSRPNWHQGFAVVVWKEIDGRWYFSVEQVRIHEGVAIFRDKTYRG